ncbi:MAG: type VI secretion protein IcmF/TssM N-terminal domain-containing protein [Planctomycetota bacterium]
MYVIATFLRQLAWIPGLGFLDMWATNMLSRGAEVSQTTGDWEVQAQEAKNAVTDPFGKENLAAEENAVPGAGGADAAGGAAPADASKESPAAQGDRRHPNSGDPLAQYRSERSAARASCLMFVFLVILVGVVWTIFYFDPKNVPWRHSMSWWRIAAQVILVIAIPIVLHRLIKLWLDGPSSRYSDIDYAWSQGLAALQAAGVPIDSVPLFLIVGSESHRQEIAIHSAAHMEYRAAAVPSGPAALHWYVTPQAIYLYATDVGWMSRLATPLAAGEPAAGESLIGPSDVISNAAPAAGGVEGTIMADQWRQVSDTPTAAPATSPTTGVEGTLAMSTAVDSLDTTKPTEAPNAAPANVRSISSSESTEELERLSYLCRKIRTTRAPLSPVNGVLVMLPHRVLTAGEDVLPEVERAVSADLKTICEETRLRCPVTAMVTGMEAEAGFRELIRRVGSERSIWQRFGKRFDVATVCSEAEMRSFTSHVVGAYEDWIYTLFREKDSLSKPGNSSLYELLCNVRCSLQSRLERLLVRVFSDNDQSLLMSGCYFTATGNSPDRQAFIRGVLDKLSDEQELLEWTEQAKREDRRVRLLAGIGILTTLIGVAAIIYFLGQRWLYW